MRLIHLSFEWTVGVLFALKKKEEVFAPASVVSFEYWAVRKPVCRRVGFFGYGPGAVRNKTNGPANKVENFYFYYFFSKRKFMQITGYAYNERPANKNSLEKKIN